MHIIRICGTQSGLLKGLLLSHNRTKSVFIKRTSLKTNLAMVKLVGGCDSGLMIKTFLESKNTWQPVVILFHIFIISKNMFGYPELIPQVDLFTSPLECLISTIWYNENHAYYCYWVGNSPRWNHTFQVINIHFIVDFMLHFEILLLCFHIFRTYKGTINQLQTGGVLIDIRWFQNEGSIKLAVCFMGSG